MNKVLGNKKSIAVFVLPAFLIYAVFVLVPIGYNVYVSFLQTDLMSPSKFVGIKNYVNLFRDSTFTGALKNNIDGDWVVDRAFAVGAAFWEYFVSED